MITAESEPTYNGWVANNSLIAQWDEGVAEIHSEIFVGQCEFSNNWTEESKITLSLGNVYDSDGDIISPFVEYHTLVAD